MSSANDYNLIVWNGNLALGIDCLRVSGESQRYAEDLIEFRTTSRGNINDLFGHRHCCAIFD